MNNTKLLRFIDKYHLGGEIKSVKWVSNGNKLSTRFISGDKSVVGSVVLDKFDGIDSSELGVYNTSQLISLLTILGDDIKFNLSSAGEKFISIDMVDTTRNTKSKYMLIDLSVIPTPPPMKNLPDKFELKLDVTRYFINTFINGKSALPDSDFILRLSDDRLGYFTTIYQDYTNIEQETPYVRYINRWNLKKKYPTNVKKKF